MKGKGIYILLLLIVSVNAYSCKKKSMTAEEFVSHVKDESSEYNYKKTVGDYEFSLQYQPPIYQALDELNHTGNGDYSKVQQKAKDYEGIYQFVFKIATKKHDQDVMKYGINGTTEYYQRLQYFISSIQKDFFLAHGKDTLSCAFSNFERTYSISPFSTFILVFDRKKGSQTNSNTDNSYTFIYNDQLLGVGQVNMQLDGQVLSNTPSIITQ